MDRPVSIISFHDYWIDKMCFEKNRAMHRKYDGQLDFKLEINYEPKENGLLVSLGVQLYDRDFSHKELPFYLDVVVTGEFSVNHQGVEKIGLDEVAVRSALKANTVAILFPYVRSIISSLTLMANEEAVILPPINTFELIKEKQTISSE